MVTASCLADSRNLIGEGPLWHPGQRSIYWTDINGFRLERYHTERGERTAWRFDEPACALSLTTDPDVLLVLLGSRLILWRPADDQRTELARPEIQSPYNRMNDGATDPRGNFWCGSMRNNVGPAGEDVEAEGHTGAIFRVAANGAVTEWDKGYNITNGPAWSPDAKTFYCTSSMDNTIYAYDYRAEDAAIGNRRIFFAGDGRGLPDGCAVDARGRLWCCRFFGKCILVISPEGKVERAIEMPVTNITSCVFGGDDLRTLYITTASLHAPEGESMAGGLFALKTDVEGLPPGRFRL